MFVRPKGAAQGTLQGREATVKYIKIKRGNKKCETKGRRRPIGYVSTANNPWRTDWFWERRRRRMAIELHTSLSVNGY